jgi:two-component sensor histidine kinase
MLTVVNAMANQSAARSDPETFVAHFSERLVALAAGLDLLIQNDWRGVDLFALVRSQLSHFRDLIGSRIVLEGPRLVLSPAAAQTIGMAMHELATNAAKFGALSTDGGVVEVAWKTCNGADAPQFDLSWAEHGGPAAQAPARKGFGHVVTVTVIEEALRARVTSSYTAGGFAWAMSCPLASLLAADRLRRREPST